MKYHPILFSAPMVRAILDGRKTQTRRVAKLTANGHVKEPGGHRRWHTADFDARLACPYGQPGDRLWVRETFFPEVAGDPNFPVWYRATEADEFPYRERWKPSIHMPRWASRITLEITGVRVEKLNDISEADAIAEGVTDTGAIILGRMAEDVTGPIAEYAVLWESINGPGSWDENPWVWMVEFKRVEGGAS